MKYSGIGGQAVMEGVMMKNKDLYAVAVRMPNGDITVKREKFNGLADRGAFFRLPFFRGVFNFIDSLVLGLSALNYSSSFYEDEEEEKTEKDGKPKKEKTPEQKAREEKAFSIVTMMISVVLALAIFVVGPNLLKSLVLDKFLPNAVSTLIEGVLRLAIFIAYVGLISLMEDIKRVYMYHGAEHKCINCIEHGLELTVENVRASSRQHKRCGTSFLLIVMVIAIATMILVAVLVPINDLWFNICSRLILIPVIAGISYEFLRIGGRCDNAFVNFMSKPGLALQGLTTREPDDAMIEVGIASVEAVFDWRAYLAENFSGTTTAEASCCTEDKP